MATNATRIALVSTVARVLDEMWSKDRSWAPDWSRPATPKFCTTKSRDFRRRTISNPLTTPRRWVLPLGLVQTRWLMYEQRVSSVSLPMLIILILWLSIIFISFGLFAPTNATVVVSLLAAALSVSGAIFLIIEMYSPYAGLIQISPAPLRFALAHLGQ